MNNEDIKETLSSLGYNLLDRGSYWQTNAIYRNGDNKTAIQIYKDSGVWKDYVEQTPFMPLEKLIKITLGTTDDDLVKSYIKKTDAFSFESNLSTQPKIKMEKTYPEKYLKKLLPHYKFYNERGISDNTLKVFKGGMATEGKMNGRFVFPIFNLNGKIHGFSGRDLFSSKNRPKWKHIGQKSKWLFPNQLLSFEKEDCKDIFLVESIGDVLNLFECGFNNVLCTFGLDFSPSLITYLMGLNPNRIFISLNDDSSSTNAGNKAACKNFFKMLSYFDYTKLYLHPPTKNDFGDMNKEEVLEWNISKENVDKENQDKKLILYGSKLISEKYIAQSMSKNLKNLKKIYE